MSKEQYKLHPISAVINFINGIKDLFIPIAILLMSRLFNNSSEGFNFWTELFPILIVVVPSVLYLLSGIIEWWTFRYWFENGELRVKYGLFIKKRRFIPFERIQSLNHKEGVFHRLFGLVEVSVETAGGSSPEVVLTAITKEAAKRVEVETSEVQQDVHQQFVGEDGTIKEVEVKSISNLIHKMSTKDLLILATTSNSIGVVITGILAAYSQVSDFIPYDFIWDELQHIMKFGFIVVTFIIFIAFFIAWLISVIITFFKYYGFTVTEENDRLIITHGLIEKKRVTIPLNRVQAIKIVENPFRQLFGLATVMVESAGSGFDEKDLKMPIFPLISRKEMYEPLRQLFPKFEWELPIIHPTKRGRPFFYRKDFLWMIPLIVLCSYYFYPYGLLSIFVVIPIILLRIWQFKTTGIAIFDKQLVIIYRVINRVTFVAEKKRIQALEAHQSFFQKRRNVSSIQATVMSSLVGTTAKAVHLEDAVVEKVMNWFERK